MIASTNRASTGIKGLDEILHGGLLPARAYLVTGAPGTGKTLFGFQFLTANEKRSLFISLIEPEEHLRENASTLGIGTESIDFLDLTADPEVFSEAQAYDIFSPTEIEREPMSKAIRTTIEEINPERIFIDGFSQLRAVSSDLFQFQRMAQSLFRFATSRGATILVSDAMEMPDAHAALQCLADGVIGLSRQDHLRSIEIVKLRGSAFLPSRHPMRITASGLEIFPEAA